MAVVLLIAVFAGFARSYFLAGIFRAPLPSLAVHLHGAAFSLWILLLIAQTSLVAAGRTDLHRKLGMAGFVLGSVMVVFGVVASTDLLIRHAGKPGFLGLDNDTFYVIPMSDMVVFPILLFFGFRNRSASSAHKRYMLLATVSLMMAAVARWSLPFPHTYPVVSLLTEAFLLPLIGYDLWALRKLHRATLWGSAFLIFVQQTRVPFGKTALWHSFADWMLAHFS